jgi:hypothetical protein
MLERAEALAAVGRLVPTATGPLVELLRDEEAAAVVGRMVAPQVPQTQEIPDRTAAMVDQEQAEE